MNAREPGPGPGPLRRYAAAHGHDDFLTWIGREPRHVSNDARGLLVTRSADTPVATPSLRLTPTGVARRKRQRAQRRALVMLRRLVLVLLADDLAAIAIAAKGGDPCPPTTP